MYHLRVRFSDQLFLSHRRPPTLRSVDTFGISKEGTRSTRPLPTPPQTFVHRFHYVFDYPPHSYHFYYEKMMEEVVVAEEIFFQTTPRSFPQPRPRRFQWPSFCKKKNLSSLVFLVDSSSRCIVVECHIIVDIVSKVHEA